MPEITPMDSYKVIVNIEGAIFKDGRYLLVVRGEKEDHAPGALTLVGGKVELFEDPIQDDVLENTLRREILEEVTIDVEDDMAYIESASFLTDAGDLVVDLVFLCKYKGGTPSIGDEEEVDGLRWMTAQEIVHSSEIPDWTRRSIEKAENKRVELGW
jgi:8-oxo-dGTP diphosphatase